MTSPLRPLAGLLLAGLLLGVAGCSALPGAVRYSLSDPAAATTTNAQSIVLVVTLPEAVDRRQWVVQLAPGETVIDDSAQWQSPLRNEIAQAVAARLAQRGVGGGEKNAAHLTIDITHFDTQRGVGVALAARWTWRPADPAAKVTADASAVRSGQFARTLPVSADSMAALAAAHRDALRALADDIADAMVMSGTR